MLLGTACNSTGCLENRNSVPLAGFYDASTEKSVTLDSLEIVGLDMPIDTPLYAAGERLQQVYLPMRSVQSTTTWLFHYRYKELDTDALTDTLHFAYYSTPYFASADCGVVYHYLITEMSHTDHLIERVVISDSLITNLDVQQISIYFKMQEEEAAQ